MKRRSFIKTAAMSSLFPYLLTSGCKLKPLKNKIEGFIFSDAHIGWEGKDQPSLETQAEMIKVIRTRFPDLDLVFDTGDVHHVTVINEERRKAREFWLNNMAGEFPDSLFHYIPGNHELDMGFNDAEQTAGELGSFAFRPYYSFDFKGIHFVSLPQLLDTILITEESLNWLKQDLKINKDKTTLIFSHNSIQNTTYTNDESGYRETVNSNDVLNILNEHGSVLGWFHGHNHQYEIVPKHNRLYVSNGRIGGFNPPKRWGDFGQDHLGGIYFRIDKNGLDIKCFSASKNQFFEDIGKPHLSNQIEIPTSFNLNKGVNYYFGHGKINSSLKFNIYNHYLSKKFVEYQLTKNQSNHINENYRLEFPSDYWFAGRDMKRLIGFTIYPINSEYSVNSEGLEFKVKQNQNDRNFVHILFPIEGYPSPNYLSRSGYYRCGLDQKLMLQVYIAKNTLPDKIEYQYKLLTQSHKEVYISDYQKLDKASNQKYEDLIHIPSEIGRVEESESLYVFFRLKVFGKEEKITIASIELNHVGETNNHAQTTQLISNEKQITTEFISQDMLFNEGAGKIGLAKSPDTFTLIFKVVGVEWQIRNAIASIDRDKITIHKMRSDFQKNKEIILTPTLKRTSYISKLRNISQCSIDYSNNSVVIEIIQGNTDAFLELSKNSVIKSIDGGKLVGDINSSGNWVKPSYKTIKIQFA